jgi:hypothetical protein
MCGRKLDRVGPTRHQETLIAAIAVFPCRTFRLLTAALYRSHLVVCACCSLLFLMFYCFCLCFSFRCRIIYGNHKLKYIILTSFCRWLLQRIVGKFILGTPQYTRTHTMHVYHTYIHEYMPYIHTYIHKYIHTCIYACMHVCTTSMCS